jgi:hypothetical protein
VVDVEARVQRLVAALIQVLLPPPLSLDGVPACESGPSLTPSLHRRTVDAMSRTAGYGPGGTANGLAGSAHNHEPEPTPASLIAGYGFYIGGRTKER